jgi:OOP family OmpA-OmpF porin
MEFLDKLAQGLKDNPKECLLLTVSGHTDQKGSHEYNDALSLRRADAVRDYLVSSGIDVERIKTVGFGKRQPLNMPGRPEVRDAADRRVGFECSKS